MNDHKCSKLVACDSSGLRKKNCALTSALLALAASGCGANDATTTESIQRTHAEFSFGDCANVAADQTFENKIDPSWLTPREYDTCGGYVVDIDAFYAHFADPPDDTAYSARLNVDWGDTPITSERQCVRSTLDAIVSIWSGTAPPLILDSGTVTGSIGNTASVGVTGGPPTPGFWFYRSAQHRGEWADGACSIDHDIRLDIIMTNGGPTYYRVAVRALTGTETRQVRLSTDGPLIGYW